MDDQTNHAGDTGAGRMVDWDAALDVAAGDEELLVEILEAFQTETPKNVATIRQALGAGDARSLHRAAHTLKNSCYNIGAQATGDLAFQLERLGKDASFDQVPPLLEQLELEMGRIEREVDQYIQTHQN